MYRYLLSQENNYFSLKKEGISSARKSLIICIENIPKGIDKIWISYYYAQMTREDNAMNPRYVVGQKVIIKPISEHGISQREDEINQYAGKVGEISDLYWISPRTGQVFYIYNVRVDEPRKEIVVYEDEMEACLT